MPATLFITDQRMLELVEYAVGEGIVRTQTQFFEEIGFSRTAISNVRAGRQGFTPPQILKACLLTGVSADWVYGLITEMTPDRKKKKPMDMLKEAVRAVELQLKNR